MSVNDEGRDMWKVYLDIKDYAAALVNCRDQLQRDQVYLVQVTPHILVVIYVIVTSKYEDRVLVALPFPINLDSV